LRRKRLFQQIVGDRQIVVQVHGRLEFSLLLAAQLELATQAGNAVAACLNALWPTVSPSNPT